MTSQSIEESLARAEQALETGSGLSGTGFWRSVTTVKRNPELADRYADRIAMIDEQAHRQWALLIIPLWLGTLLAWAAFLVGLALVWWAYELSGTEALVAFFAGTGVLLASTHGLGHLVVGRLLGMRFSYWFVGEVTRPQPGVKIDYAVYLRTPPRRRAW
ncbi:MAG TPA: hypothetical protein VFT85_01520, partial [Acidimicrobiia bacterium]|nr:hypothetical protein [Acidimicrobiia bacterium]